LDAFFGFIGAGNLFRIAETLAEEKYGGKILLSIKIIKTFSAKRPYC